MNAGTVANQPQAVSKNLMHIHAMVRLPRSGFDSFLEKIFHVLPLAESPTGLFAGQTTPAAALPPRPARGCLVFRKLSAGKHGCAMAFIRGGKRTRAHDSKKFYGEAVR
jgi:hypothetical protein